MNAVPFPPPPPSRGCLTTGMSAVQRDTHLKERKCSAAIVQRAALCLVSFNFLVCCRKLRNLRVSLKVLAEGKRFTAA